MMYASDTNVIRRNRNAFATATAAAALLAFTMPALADDGVEQVVVTASRTATPIDRIPARVSVITREDIEQQNFVTAVDALKEVPGLSVVQSGGAGGLTSIFARGTNSAHVLALYDGIRLNDASSPNGQYNFGEDTLGDLSRVEVVRGASASIYGSDAIGGVINFIPRVGAAKPFAPYFEVSAGGRDTYHGLAGVRGTMGDLSYMVSAERYQTAGFNNTPARFPDNLGEADGSHFTTVTGIADYTLDDSVKLRGLVRWRKTHENIDDVALDRYGHTADDKYFLWRIGPQFTLLNRRLAVVLDAGQVQNSNDDLDHADVNQPFPAPATFASGRRSFADWRNTYSFDDFGFVSDASVTAGAEYVRDKVSVTGGYSYPLQRAEDQSAVYGLTQFRIARRVDVTGSVRYDHTQSFGDQTTWNIGAVLDLPEVYSRLYASDGTSFKGPSLSERYSQSAYNVGNPDLQPEHGRSWEVGFDTTPPRLAGIQTKFGATYYRSRIRNLIDYDFAALQNVNIGEARIDGYEAYLEIHPFEIAALRVNYTYTDAVDGDSGARLLRRPPQQWSATLTLTPTERLTITADYLFRGSRWDVLYGNTNPYGPGGGYLGNGPVGSYDLVNLDATYQVTGELQAFAGVRNLFDRTYEDPNAYRGEPRSWLIGLRGAF